MNDTNAMAVLLRLSDRARQLGYHQNQIRIIANEILDLAESLREHLSQEQP